MGFGEETTWAEGQGGVYKRGGVIRNEKEPKQTRGKGGKGKVRKKEEIPCAHFPVTKGGKRVLRSLSRGDNSGNFRLWGGGFGRVVELGFVGEKVGEGMGEESKNLWGREHLKTNKKRSGL